MILLILNITFLKTLLAFTFSIMFKLIIYILNILFIIFLSPNIHHQIFLKFLINLFYTILSHPLIIFFQFIINQLSKIMALFLIFIIHN